MMERCVDKYFAFWVLELLENWGDGLVADSFAKSLMPLVVSELNRGTL